MNSDSKIKEKNKIYQDMGLKILYTCKNEICARFPFFSQGAAALSFIMEEIDSANQRVDKIGTKTQITSIGTDGEYIKAQPLFLIQTWAEEPEMLKRGYLHMLFHCLYLHPFYGGKREKRLWNLACDLAVELLAEENLPQNLWGFSDEKKKADFTVL